MCITDYDVVQAAYAVLVSRNDGRIILYTRYSGLCEF